MKKLLFGFGILAMLFATTMISSCGDAESTDEKSELQEGEEKACCKDKDCKDKECEEASETEGGTEEVE